MRSLRGCATLGELRDMIARTAFTQACATAAMPETTRLAATIEAWWPQIEGFLELGVTESPQYSEVLQRIKDGDNYLDIGCCVGQFIR